MVVLRRGCEMRIDCHRVGGAGGEIVGGSDVRGGWGEDDRGFTDHGL